MGYTKVIQSGNIIEFYEYQNNLPERRKSTKKGLRRNRSSASRRPDHVERLRRNFVRLVRSNLVGTECPIFLTLTMVEVVRIEISYGLLTRFIQRLRRLYGKDFRYIAVPEFQKRGAVHFHLLAWGLPAKIEINESNNRTIQHVWQYGFVDCFRTDGSPKLAQYVAKYMHKAVFDDRLHLQKAYVCSRNVLRPLSFSSSAVVGASSEIWGIDLSTASPLREKEFSTQWLGKGRYKSFNLEKDENHHNKQADFL